MRDVLMRNAVFLTFTAFCVAFEDPDSKLLRNEENDWPIFVKIKKNLLRSVRTNEWVTLISKSASGKETVASKQIAYPPFEEDCQIPNLGDIYLQLIGFKKSGIFVEVGACDGRRWSNTYPLANIGWTGHYIEPVAQYAYVCASNHAHNSKIQTHILAIGANQGIIDVFVGSSLSTASKEMLNVYRSLDWSAGYHTGEVVRAPQRTLDHFLAAAGVPPGFDVLVVDVEGMEWEPLKHEETRCQTQFGPDARIGAEACQGHTSNSLSSPSAPMSTQNPSQVLQGFSAGWWRPRVVIMEIEDAHESFSNLSFVQERGRRIRGWMEARGYRQHWADAINTIFASQPP